MVEFLKSVVEHGGVFAYLLIGLGVFALAVAIERFYVLNFRYSINGQEFWKEIRRRILGGEVEDAIKLCDNAPLPQIIKSGLVEAAKASPRVKEAMDETSLEVIPRIEKRTHYLSMAANVAVLIGLLGTVRGIILAFAAVSNADPAVRAEMLASGIALALNATFMGLAIAIPSLLAYSFLQSKATKLIDEIDEYSLKTFHLLRARREVA
ncbi:MAG: MotA/TolQ/ExbB proton channel family protein [Candidatus Binatia bacterium]